MCILLSLTQHSVQIANLDALRSPLGMDHHYPRTLWVGRETYEVRPLIVIIIADDNVEASVSISVAAMVIFKDPKH
jgi:hypothetical protein